MQEAKAITRSNLPFYVSWICIIVWLDCFVLPGGLGSISRTRIALSSPSAFSYVYILTTAAVICVFRVKDLLPFTKYSAALAILGMLVGAVGEGGVTQVAMVIAALGLGHVFASSGYGFIMVLNNQEKIWSMSLSVLISKFLLLLMEHFAENMNLLQTLGWVQGLCLLPLLLCTYYFTPGNESFAVDKRVLPKDFLLIGLAAAVFLLNDFVAPALWRSLTNIPAPMVRNYHATGVILGVCLTLVFHHLLNINICYILNLSFAMLTLGLVTDAVGLGGSWRLVSTSLFGMSHAMGIISVYYMLGIYVKKSRNLNFYRFGVLLSTLFHMFGFYLAGNLQGVNSPASAIVTVFSVAAVMAIFALTPLFTRMLYFAEWTDDLNRPDVIYTSKLTAHLSDLRLTPKEIEVCVLLLEGLTMRQISGTLNIAYSTVNTYCTAIYRKLGINSRTELLVRFSQHLITK